MPRIREWTERDLPKLMAIERACFDDPWTTEMMKGEFVREQFCGVLAEREDGEILGYACGTSLFEDAELFKIAVGEEFRGQGHGAALLHELFELVKGRGATRMFLEVRVSNAAALGLYQSRGFQKTRIRKRYYENGEDALEMKKDFYPEA